MDTTTEKIILEKLDKLDNSFEGLKTLIDEEHKKNAVYRYKVDELEKKSEKTSNRNWDWGKSIAIALIGTSFAVILGVSINSMVSKDAENKKMQLELQKKELELKLKRI